MQNSETSWFNTWPDGLIGITKHHRIVELSPIAQSILGYSRDELYGEHLHELLCADARGFQHDIDFCPLTAAQIPDETTSALWRHKNGHIVSVDFRVISVGYGEATRIISFVDNSTRLHSQAEMQKFYEYVEMSPAPLAEFVMDGQLLFGNNALQELILEYGFDDHGAANVIPNSIASIGEKLLQSEDEYPYSTVEIQVAQRVFSWHLHILQNSGTLTMVGYAFDITAQKEAEEVAERQNSQARKEFYAKMVHELRSPLNAIVGFSDLLIDDLRYQIGEEHIQRLQLVKEAGIQMNDQVSATLDIAKIESGKMSLDISNFAIKDVCRDVVNTLSSLALEKKLELKFTSLTQQRIFSDQTKVRQIIINLVSNAIKYTHEGRIDLVASEKNHERFGECISIVVSDTGIGIEADQIPRLFASFEQVDTIATRKIEGTGLGLALVSNLLKLLGGEVSVMSTVGVGSTFEVLLPFLSNESLMDHDASSGIQKLITEP